MKGLHNAFLKDTHVIMGVSIDNTNNDIFFVESIMQTLHKFTVNIKNIYMLWEINIDLLKSSNNHVLDFVNLTNCFGLRNLVNKPTRVTKELTLY